MGNEPQVQVGTVVLVRQKYRWYDGKVLRRAGHIKWPDDGAATYYEVEFIGWLGRRKRVWVYSDDIRIPESA